MSLLSEYDWVSLEKLALSAVEKAQYALPVELKKLADELPVIFRRWHPDAKGPDDEASETLGEYLSFEDNRVSEENGPIALYLGAIQRYSLEENLDFAEEVRITYLHELGHHLGWDEEDLANRNLD